MSTWIIWLIIAVVMLLVELLGPNLISIWFCVAALIMAPISLLNLPIWLQCVIFMILSIAFMFVLRKLYVTKIKPKNKLKDNLEDKIINETAVVTKTIDNSKNEGQVIVSGMYWQAISSDGSIINVGDNVSIDKIENMKLFVTKNQIERR